MLTYEEYRQKVEEGIVNLELPAEPAGLTDPIRYALACGGKRLRPVLTLATAQALGTAPSKALSAALAIEIYHNFTLLHDDVMDNADLRRGRPTVHRKWNEATAILSGDAMLTFASQILAKGAAENPGRFVTENTLFNQKAMDVYRGQQYDMDFENRTDVNEAEYIVMIRLNTSVLLGCACRMGALVAGATAEECDAFWTYGEKIGLAFQLRDDYLDTYGDVELFGKEVGGDILNDKKTWLSVMAMADPRSQSIVKLFGNSLPAQEKIARVRELYDKAELPQRIRALIDRYSHEADEALAAIRLTPEAREFFTLLTRKLCSRVV